MNPADLSDIQRANKRYWDENGDDYYDSPHSIILPDYGADSFTEDELNLFGDVSGRALLDIGCGSGKSLLYHAARGAGELWGVDISETQVSNTAKCLAESGYQANLICGAMEDDLGLPVDYFDFVYSIYAIGWTINLPGTFRRIASYLKRGGAFIFSWTHPMQFCTAFEDGKVFFDRSYFDETWAERELFGKKVLLPTRKISDYVNALSGAGLFIEHMDERARDEILCKSGETNEPGVFERKGQAIPRTVIFKARKR